MLKLKTSVATPYASSMFCAVDPEARKKPIATRLEPAQEGLLESIIEFFVGETKLTKKQAKLAVGRSDINEFIAAITPDIANKIMGSSTSGCRVSLTDLDKLVDLAKSTLAAFADLGAKYTGELAKLCNDPKYSGDFDEKSARAFYGVLHDTIDKKCSEELDKNFVDIKQAKRWVGTVKKSDMSKANAVKNILSPAEPSGSHTFKDLGYDSVEALKKIFKAKLDLDEARKNFNEKIFAPVKAAQGKLEATYIKLRTAIEMASGYYDDASEIKSDCEYGIQHYGLIGCLFGEGSTMDFVASNPNANMSVCGVHIEDLCFTLMCKLEDLTN